MFRGAAEKHGINAVDNGLRHVLMGRSGVKRRQVDPKERVLAHIRVIQSRVIQV